MTSAPRSASSRPHSSPRSTVRSTTRIPSERSKSRSDAATGLPRGRAGRLAVGGRRRRIAVVGCKQPAGRETALAQVTEMTVKFPYRRSLGPVLGAFMTALTEQSIIGIRKRRPGHRAAAGVGSRPPGAELAHDFVDVGPAGTVESWSWVAKPDLAAPARPAVRLRAGEARRRRHRAHARGRRRLDRRDVDRHARRAALEGRAHRPHHRHRGVRPGRDARDPRRRRAPTSRSR